ncbi:unnamed protein product [Callosobruchus maculatus]|uniref:DDE Tnp4 domain-containing protein n=1 Tax=Callosobruchus maculatus TaxID=64391 RepID=A0A653D863_CALMS|nr:unnamed protein product [Callosobruchus maculatus]
MNAGNTAGQGRDPQRYHGGAVAVGAGRRSQGRMRRSGDSNFNMAPQPLPSTSAGCFRCGRNHSANICPYKDYICNACHGRGHLSVACKKPKQSFNKHVNYVEQNDEFYDDTSDFSSPVLCIATVGSNSDKPFCPETDMYLSNLFRQAGHAAGVEKLNLSGALTFMGAITIGPAADVLVDGGTPWKVSSFVAILQNVERTANFRKHFKVSKNTFHILVEMFEGSEYFPKNTFGKCTKTAETHIAAFLRFAGNKCVLRTVAQIFNTSISTMFVIIERVMSFLMSINPKIIKFPDTTDKKESVAAKFRKVAGFSGVLGCIDGPYIPIRTPARKLKSTYINRHDQTLITLQGICDHKK